MCSNLVLLELKNQPTTETTAIFKKQHITQDNQFPNSEQLIHQSKGNFSSNQHIKSKKHIREYTPPVS